MYKFVVCVIFCLVNLKLRYNVRETLTVTVREKEEMTVQSKSTSFETQKKENKKRSVKFSAL